MNNKIAQYLQAHISGEIISSSDVRRHFSTDASIFTITPNVVVYPRNENDIRKTTRFTWQLAERGRVFPITARGFGTDMTGAAIGSGILLVFPAHMNRILELDNKNGTVIIEPGINFTRLQQTLLTHDRFLPPEPASSEFSTVGGAIANNASGLRSLKYGSMVDFVKGLRVVLANGDVIETKRLSKRELNKKLGLSNFEGEIYRTIDLILEENPKLVDKLNLNTTKNAAGYNLHLVKRKDGSFDLTPLFVGSQGTLGIITEATLDTTQRHPTSLLMVAMVDDVNILQDTVLEIRKLPELPSAIELVDENLLRIARKNDPELINSIIKEPFPKFVLLIEFDNLSEHVQKRLSKRVIKILKDNQIPYRIESDLKKKEELWKMRFSTTANILNTEGNARPIPIIEDGIVPPENISKYINGIYGIFESNKIPTAVFGHIGDGHLLLQPLLDLNQVGDRQKIFKMMEDYYTLVISLQGSITAQHGEGRLRSVYLPYQFGKEAYEMLKVVKQTFDPHGILNPGVKFGGSIDSMKSLLRDEYSLSIMYRYLPYI